jgi:hypothetical protein
MTRETRRFAPISSSLIEGCRVDGPSCALGGESRLLPLLVVRALQHFWNAKRFLGSDP